MNYFVYYVFLLCLVIAQCCNAKLPRRDIGFFTEAYGVVPEQKAPRAYQIFAKVLRVAEVSHRFSPELVIINDREDASAFALSSGHIVISSKTLDILYRDVKTHQGDTRLAFVFGHEIAHLVANDFWEDSSIWALYDSKNGASSKTLDSTKRQNFKKEVRADENGFLYATLAGFHVDQLLLDGKSQENFFSFWQRVNKIKRIDSYPSPKERAMLLVKQLQSKIPVLDYFHYGTKFASFGRYEEAIHFFREFQKIYPHKEVFLNLAFCQIQQARKLFNLNTNDNLWLMPVLDTQTSFSEMAKRFQYSLLRAKRGESSHYNNELASQHLLKAIEFLEISLDKDERYISAYYNIALSWLYLHQLSPIKAGKLLKAKAMLEQAVAFEPKDRNINYLHKIVSVLADKTDSSKNLKALNAYELNGIEAYNVALLLHSNREKAAPYWSRVIENQHDLPQEIKQQICNGTWLEHIDAQRGKCIEGDRDKVKKEPYKLPVAMWRDLLDEPFTAEEEKRYAWDVKRTRDFTIYENDRHTIFISDDIVSFQVLKKPSIDLSVCCGKPKFRVSTPTGELWNYGSWIAELNGAHVESVWVSN